MRGERLMGWIRLTSGSRASGALIEGGLGGLGFRGSGVRFRGLGVQGFRDSGG